MGSASAGSLIDMLPPEAQHVLGIAALVVVALGLILWAAGVKIARLVVAILVGAAGAIVGAWLGPAFLGLGAVSGALAGFAAGVLTGALAFRLLQGLTLAVCLGLAVAGAYYHWHVQIAEPPPHQALPQGTPKSDSVPASDLLIQGPLAGAGRPGPSTNETTGTGQRLLERWNAVPPNSQHRMLIAGIGTAAAVLLLAFGFARQTTWAVTAALGTLMLLLGVEALGHVYAPGWQLPLPGGNAWRYGLAIALTLLGMLIQWRYFWPETQRKQARPAREKMRGEKRDRT